MRNEQDLNELVEREYPYPIARKFVFVSERPKGWFDRYRRVVDCFEAIVRFSALEMVLEYYRTGATDMEHNTRILSILLNPKTAHGTWVEILRETSKRLEGRQGVFLKEFSGWYTKAGKPTPIVHDTIETYTASRNQFLGHPECTRSEGFYREQYLLESDKLLRLLASLDFLANYQLIVPVRIDGDLVDEYHVGRGARLKTSLNPIRLPGLSLQDSERSVLLLRHPIDPDGNNPFLLYPFLLYRYQADHDRDWADLFVFGSCQAERARTTPKSLRFFSYDIGVPPLETSTQGDRYAHLLQAFAQLVNALTATSESRGQDERPQFSCYFEIQRDEIERLIEGYVSRSDVEQRIVEAAHDTRQGIILVNGGPGTGKSSLAASLVNQYGWPHHFIVAGDQIRRQAGPIIRSLSWQLNEKYKLGMEIPQHDDNLGFFYGNLLFRVSQSLPENEKAIILIDALDELSDTDQFSLDFVPPSIPRGVVFIVTSRNDQEYRELKEGSDQVALDIEVPPVTESEARAMVGTLGDTLTDSEFGALYHTSEGNPLYLASIRRDFERTGSISISDLPKKMEGIFASYMKRLKKLEDPLIMEVLALVCTFKEPPHAWQLAQILGTREQALRD